MSIKTFLLVQLGFPENIRQFFADFPESKLTIAAPTSIALDDIPNWADWPTDPYPAIPFQAETLRGWRQTPGGYLSFSAHPMGFTHLGQVEKNPHWRCDIRNIAGFSSSKATLSQYTSILEMVKDRCAEEITSISEEAMHKALTHDQIRLIHSPEYTTDHFVIHGWDGRIFLCNAGGSHHLATAIVMAQKLDIPYYIEGPLSQYSLNYGAVSGLLMEYEAFALQLHPEAADRFHEGMKALRATYLTYPLPSQYPEGQVIFLPRNERRSMRVAQVFRECGQTDFGEFLTSLC